MSENSAERVARNQALFREVNERIEDLAAGAAAALGRIDSARDQEQSWVCECHRTECVERIRLTVGEYERVRAHANRFVVAAGADHVAAEHEHVVSEGPGYWVMEKVGTAGELAAALDPRSQAGSA